jgi:transcriptional regulator GlxA family with amidase domain
MKIRIVVFDGVDELDFVGPYEVFRRAAKLGKDADVALVTLAPQPEITAAHGLKVRADGTLQEADVLVVPGGGWAARAATGVRAEVERGELPRKIAHLHGRGTVIAGVCTGAMAIAAAGLLKQRPAVTHHSAIEDLRATTAQVHAARVVDAGDIVTSGGVTASIDLALWVVERFWGRDTADRIANDLEYTRSSDVYVAGAKGH